MIGIGGKVQVPYLGLFAVPVRSGIDDPFRVARITLFLRRALRLDLVLLAYLAGLNPTVSCQLNLPAVLSYLWGMCGFL
jgi:hypothetical protein